MRLFIVSLIVLFAAGCSPQRKIMRSFRYGEYQKVIDFYSKELAKNPDNPSANYYVAESYRLSNRLRESLPFYAKANMEGGKLDSSKFYYAKALASAGKIDSAYSILQDLIRDSRNRRIQTRAKQELAVVKAQAAFTPKKNFYQVKNLEVINTAFSEYSPYFQNGELYFTSSRTNGKIYEATGTPFSDIYKASSKGAVVDAETIAPLPPAVNAPSVNEGCIAFTPDGNTMVFAKGNNGKRKDSGDVDLYISRFKDGQWTQPSPININLPDSWESTPAFSADGKTLFFSSNRRGGAGGLDIYSSAIDSRGRFGKVRNLGPSVNTVGNEMFPYQSSNGKLYFSSDGWPGFGMLDIFEMNRVKGKPIAENLGEPVNSPGDDFGFFLFKADRGFFASNREGGKGDDDIYTFVNKDPNLKIVNYLLQGITYFQKKDNSREILPNARVTLLDDENKPMESARASAAGKFTFKVYENENYRLLAEADGYLVKRQPFTTLGKSIPKDSLKELETTVTLDTVMVLDALEKNKIFVLENIYFEYNKDNIRPDAAHELNKLVVLLNDNPEIKIEMGSHTDSVASDAYNKDLSQRRANSTVQYLIQKGIVADRLSAKGYGESVPVARNTNPDGTDNPEGRARNRRTEFKIVDILDVPKSQPTEPNDDDDAAATDEKKDAPDEADEEKFFKDELEKERMP